MPEYYVDLHIHIGRTSGGKEIKKATSKDLTFENIAYEAYFRKGINVIGVVDCISPYVIEDIEKLMEKGELTEIKDGGFEYRKGLIILPGAEIETREKYRGSAHSLCFFKDLLTLKDFSKAVSSYMKNIENSCTMSSLTGQELFDLVEEYNGIFIPAHIFTPHKSFYGNCCSSLHEIFNNNSFEKISAVELGLSADSDMASQLIELDNKTFLSNSDAHSLSKIGREYNIFEMDKSSYIEIIKALKGIDGRKVKKNFGLDPRLGKYHRSYCINCDKVIEGEPPVMKCPDSQKHRIIVGVKDRLYVIRDREKPNIVNRPPYKYHIPLEFIPKVGPKTVEKLICHFGNEMNVVHKAGIEELTSIVKNDIAQNIVLARDGSLSIKAGGGGIYGKVE